MEYRENPLYGKTIVFDGDSICQGNTEKGREPWAPYVGKRNSMQWFNYGVGGGNSRSNLTFAIVFIAGDDVT